MDDDRGLQALIARRVLDPELGALLALLLETRVPVVIAGRPVADREEVLEAMLGLLPATATVVELAGAAEEFDWLPEATELGWRRERHVLPAIGADSVPRASSSSAVLVARDLGGDGAQATGGARARLVVRSLSLGYGLVAAVDADGLDGVLDRLHAPDIGTDEDERTRIGVVIVLGETERGPRVTAAHYVRPAARDTHGHVQRLPPAVLATWSAAADTWDHFAWGVLPDLAGRAGVRPVEFEREQARRAASLRARLADRVD